MAWVRISKRSGKCAHEVLSEKLRGFIPIERILHYSHAFRFNKAEEIDADF